MSYLDPIIAQSIDLDDATDPIWGRLERFHQSITNEKLNRVPIAVMLCPSDAVASMGTNYRCNLGVSTHLFGLNRSKLGDPLAETGAFVHAKALRFADFSDGLSNTALFSERLQGDGDPDAYSPRQDYFSHPDIPQGTELMKRACSSMASKNPPSEFSFAGRSWLLGGWLNTWYSHVAAPNWRYPDCGLGEAALDGGDVVVAARSFHPGQVHLSFADGAVKGVSDKVDAAVWHAIGTRAAADRVD